MSKLEEKKTGWVINRWICALKSVWGGWPFDYYISGHQFVDVEYHRNKYVTVAVCECCGKVDISWGDTPLHPNPKDEDYER